MRICCKREPLGSSKPQKLQLCIRCAVFYIRRPFDTGEIKRFLRDDGAIKLSRSLKEASIAVMRGRELLFKELGREPTINELAEKCSLSPEDVVCALEASRPLVSIYEPVTDDGKSELLVLDKIASQTDESSDINDKIHSLQN